MTEIGKSRVEYKSEFIVTVEEVVLIDARCAIGIIMSFPIVPSAIKVSIKYDIRG